MAFGTSRTNYLGIPLPFDLALLGAPGCIVETSIDFQTPLAGDPAGHAVYWASVPYAPALEGASFYVQAIVVDFPANAFHLTVSNSVDCVIGAEVHFHQTPSYY